MAIKNSLVCDRISIVVLSLSVFFALIGFIPGGFLPAGVIKGYVFVFGVLISFIVWLLGRLIDGSFMIPWSRFFGALAFFFVTLLLSSVFSNTSALSFFGESFEQGTFIIAGSSLIALFLASTLFRTKKRILVFFSGFFLLYTCIALYQLVHLFFPSATSLGVFNSTVGTPVGMWSDFTTLSGAALIGFALVFEFLATSRAGKIVAISGSILALFFVILANSFITWVIVGFSVLCILVYKLVTMRLLEKKKFPIFVFILSLIALIFISANSLLGGFLAETLNASSPNVNPSMQSTIQVAKQSLAESPVFGAGPNRFLQEWRVYHPIGVNTHPLWNVPFNFGVSFLATVAFLGGIVGVLGVLAFVLAFLYEGTKKAFMTPVNSTSNPAFVFSTFLLTFYFFIAILLRAPSTSIVVTAFFCIGLLFALLLSDGRIREKKFAFLSDQRVSFFATLSIVGLILLSVVMIYLSTERFVSLVYFNRSIKEANAGNLMKADSLLGQASAFADTPTIERTRTAVATQVLTRIVNSPSSSQDAVRLELQQAISIGNVAARRAIELDPKDPVNYIALGDFMRVLVALKVEGALDSSKDAYQRAIDQAPHYPLPYLLMAELYFTAGDIESANIFIEKALKEKPNYTAAYFLLAQISISKGDTAGAVQKLQEAVRVDPNNPDIHFELGFLRYKNSEYNEAIASLKRAVILDPNYLNAWYFLALADDKIGLKDEAEQILKALHDRLPDNTDVATALANIQAGRPAVSAPVVQSEPISKDEKSKKSSTSGVIKNQ